MCRYSAINVDAGTGGTTFGTLAANTPLTHLANRLASDRQRRAINVWEKVREILTKTDLQVPVRSFSFHRCGRCNGEQQRGERKTFRGNCAASLHSAHCDTPNPHPNRGNTMNHATPFRSATWVFATLLTAALAPSCGSDDSPANDGSGGSSGASGAGGGGTSGSSGATTGGNAGADASAGSGGTGGSSGSSGAGGTPDGGGGSSGTDAGPTDASPDGKPPGPLDDPCPGKSPLVDHIDINCSDQCQATDTAKCAAMTSCDIPASPGVTVKTSAELPFTVRLPAKPGLSCPCKTGISSLPGAPQYTIWFRLDAAVSKETLWAKVGKPWYVVGTYAKSHDRCWSTIYQARACGRKGCAILPTGGTSGRWLGVGTNDPNAPSRTLVVRKPWASGPTCPDLWQ